MKRAVFLFSRMDEFIWLIEEEGEKKLRGTLRKYTIEFQLIERERER